MAYNVLKGFVEGSVDQHADQEIDGIKVFKNTISASVFYDTDAQSPCATIKDVAITKIKGGSENSILMMGRNQTATAAYNFKHENGTLHCERINTNVIVASGEKLTSIPCDQFMGPISAEYIKHGNGIENIRGSLQVKTGEGIINDEDGISINLSPHSGLQILSNKLSISPADCVKINTEGQTLSGTDMLLVHDTSRNTVVNTSLSNFYNSYINPKVPHAQGTPGSLQYKGKKDFESSDDMLYDSNNKTLKLNGKLSANCVVSKQKIINQGAVYSNISRTDDEVYQVTHEDYTILCDASNNVVTVKLPAAKNHCGRILNIKKTNTDKYKLNSNLVYISCEDGTIDINNRIEIKMNYSSRSLQSDGENWWVIGSKGS